MEACPVIKASPSLSLYASQWPVRLTESRRREKSIWQNEFWAPEKSPSVPTPSVLVWYLSPQRRDAELKTGEMYDGKLQKQLCVVLSISKTLPFHSTRLKPRVLRSPSLSEGTWRDSSSSVHRENFLDEGNVKWVLEYVSVWLWGLGKNVLCKSLASWETSEIHLDGQGVLRGLKAGKSFSWNISHVHLQPKTILLTEAEWKKKWSQRFVFYCTTCAVRALFISQLLLLFSG